MNARNVIATPKPRPRTKHIELAQRILDIARQRGMGLGSHLPEQLLAELCNVSRTPIRAALAVMEGLGYAVRKQDSGFSLAIDPAIEAPLPEAEEDQLAKAILRDWSARRMPATITVSALGRRYRASRVLVQNALKVLEGEDRVERAPGQAWMFRDAADSLDAQADSYDFRLVLEPAAILAPGFRPDIFQSISIRQRLEALLDVPETSFDIPAFESVDAEFHSLIAQSCPNRFISDALLRVLRQRRTPGISRGVTGFRLIQATREHLQILDHLESGQFETAADLMRAHLRLSARQRPLAASRGVPTLANRGALVTGS